MSSPVLSFEQDYANRFHGVEIKHDIRTADGSPSYDDHLQSQDTAEHVGQMRSELFTEIANKTEGLDIDSIDEYFCAIGLRRKDFLILSPQSIQAYNEITTKYGWPSFPMRSEDGGYYYGVCPIGADLAVVLRDEEAEAIHGTAFTEGHLVHELAHASSDWNEWTIDKYPDGRTLMARRMGQVIINPGLTTELPRYGDYLEEAFAATIQANYLKSQGKSHDYKNYADIAADGVAYLYADNPDLFPAMIDARKHVEGLRSVAKFIDKMQPGLYRHLHKVAYTERDFIEATKLIQNLFCETVDVPDIEV